MVANNIRKAQRKAIESLYDCTCDVHEYGKFKDPVTGVTQTGINPTPTYANQKCRLSFETIKQTTQTQTVAKVSQSIKLFIAPELTIKPNSIIKVTKFSKVTNYSFSSVPAVYATHQEISLMLADGEA